MTAAPAVTLTAADLKRQLATKRERLNTIAAERSSARRAGDTRAVLRLDVEAEDVGDEIQALEARRPQLVEVERIAGEGALAVRRRQDLERRETRQRETFWALVRGLEVVGALAHEHRLATVAVGELRAELAGNRELLGQEITLRGGAGFVLAFSERVAAWLEVQPGVDLQLEVVDRITGPIGEAARRARDAFFKHT